MLSTGDSDSQSKGDQPVILITTVDIGEGRTDRIVLRQGDSPQVI